MKFKNICEAIYEDGKLKLVGVPKIMDEILVVKIINRDLVLTQEDVKDLLQALKERSEGKTKSFEQVFR
jgi:predicted DNA-binding antitoxin AbrB/MazE fold protein